MIDGGALAEAAYANGGLCPFARERLGPFDLPSRRTTA